MLKPILASGLFVTLISTFTSTAQATSSCEIVQKNQTVEVTHCELAKSQELIKLNFERKHVNFSVYAIFEKNTPKSLSSGSRFWSRLWTSSEQESLSAQEIRLLREILERPSTTFLKSDAKGLIDVLVNMIGAEQKIKNFDRAVAMPNFIENLKYQFEPWTMICEFVGQEKLATFTVSSQDITQIAKVGDAETRCRGRCGLGCWEFLQDNKNQYTQQCFDHDICHNVAGEILGECEDEFWHASVGYMYAPNCGEAARY